MFTCWPTYLSYILPHSCQMDSSFSTNILSNVFIRFFIFFTLYAYHLRFQIKKFSISYSLHIIHYVFNSYIIQYITFLDSLFLDIYFIFQQSNFVFLNFFHFCLLSNFFIFPNLTFQISFCPNSFFLSIVQYFNFWVLLLKLVYIIFP